MTPPALEQAWLSSCDASCDSREHLTEPLDIGVDVEDLAIAIREDGRVVVTAELSLALLPRGTEEIVVDLEAAFRLVYRMQAPQNLDDQRSFTCGRALADAWPLWRTWLHQTLALMGLAPTPLPAELPAELIAQGREAFDLTLAIEKSQG